MKKANKALSILAAAAMLFGFTGTCAAAFSDDTENAVLCDIPEITDIEKTSFADMSDKPVGDMPVAEEVIITDEDNKKLLEISENNRKIKEMSVQTEFPEASVNSTNDFYYQQLSSDYKAMYNETVSLLDAMLYGSDDYSSYELIVNWDSGEKDENGNIVPDTQSETVVYYLPVSDINVSKAVIDALLCANPQYFFVECCMELADDSGNDYIGIITYNGYQNGAERTAAKAQIDSVADEWMKYVDKCPDELSKETRIAELICDNTDYHYNSKGYPDARNENQTIYGCLVNKTCVCTGFSMTFAYLCQKAGIECVGVFSNVHAWNYVNINNKWYETCTTWMNGEGFSDYTYFNRGDGIFRYYGSDAMELNDKFQMVFSSPSFAYDMPLYLETSVDVSKPCQATVTWENIYGAAYYGILVYDGGQFRYIDKVEPPVYTTANVSYTIKDLSGGKNYGFLIRALFYDPVNEKYTWTSYTSACIANGSVSETAEQRPVITKLMPGNERVGLNWTAVSGANQYAVYTYLNGKWSLAGKRTTTGMFVTGLANGTKYGFAVKAYVNGKWTGISSSDIKYAAPEDKPVITKVTPGNGRVGLNWTSVSGAKQYAVYTYLNGKWSLAGKRTTNGMYVTGLANGTKYGFAVKAYINGKWTSVTSADMVYAAPSADKAGFIVDICDASAFDPIPMTA